MAPEVELELVAGLGADVLPAVQGRVLAERPEAVAHEAERGHLGAAENQFPVDLTFSPFFLSFCYLSYLFLIVLFIIIFVVNAFISHTNTQTMHTINIIEYSTALLCFP
jgi:hypothetical protein